jgi:hypothetical protein
VDWSSERCHDDHHDHDDVHDHHYVDDYHHDAALAGRVHRAKLVLLE